MSERLVCSACRRSFELAPDNRQPWVECPHCRARNGNPAVTQAPDPFSRTGYAIFGVVLIILSGLGALVGAFAVSFVGFFRDGEPHRGEAIATLCGFLLLVAAGVLLVIIGTRPHDQPVGPGTTLFGATVLAFVVALSALIYGFSVCF